MNSILTGQTCKKCGTETTNEDFSDTFCSKCREEEIAKNEYNDIILKRKLNGHPLMYDELNIDEDGNLYCPCGSSYLHQTNVKIFQREEDRKDGLHVEVDMEEGIKVDNKVIDWSNPSPRRQGIIISFDCENCDLFPELLIYQHKGMTIIGWHNKYNMD